MRRDVVAFIAIYFLHGLTSFRLSVSPIAYNNNSLSMLCHVVYATIGFRYPSGEVKGISSDA
jgi:hypothetical protein